MKKVRTVIFSMIFYSQLIVVQHTMACPVGMESVEKARKLWEQSMVSLGGRDRILSIENLLSYNKEQTVVSLEVFPDRFWWWSESKEPIGTDVKTYDFSKNLGYRIRRGDTENFSFALSNQSKERILAGRLYTLLETRWIKPRLVGSDTIKIDGKEYDVVCTEVTFPENQETDKQITERHDYLFDQATHLVFRNIRYFDSSIGGGHYIIEYSDYVDVKGVKFARHVRDKFSQHKRWSNRTEYVTDINVTYRSDLFDKPPSIKDGPNGWKPKL